MVLQWRHHHHHQNRIVDVIRKIIVSLQNRYPVKTYATRDIIFLARYWKTPMDWTFCNSCQVSGGNTQAYYKNSVTHHTTDEWHHQSTTLRWSQLGTKCNISMTTETDKRETTDCDHVSWTIETAGIFDTSVCIYHHRCRTETSVFPIAQLPTLLCVASSHGQRRLTQALGSDHPKYLWA